MKNYATTFRAICTTTGEIKIWGGPVVQELTQARAQKWCDEKYGYLKVIGELAVKIERKVPGESDDYFFTQEN